MAFAGMIGRALAQQMLKRQVAKNAVKIGVKGAGRQVLRNGANPLGMMQGGSGKFLFVAHPNCCEKCKLLGMSPHFFNTPDVAFITHPNCLCATIEVPAGLTPAETMEWAQNPVGTMRFGFNYGQSLAPVNITERNRETQMLKFINKMRPDAPYSPRSSRKIRAEVTESQKRRIRKAVERGELGPAKDLTKRIQGQAKRIETLKQKKAERIPVTSVTAPKKRRSAIKTLKNTGTTDWIPQPMKKKSTTAQKAVQSAKRNARSAFKAQAEKSGSSKYGGSAGGTNTRQGRPGTKMSTRGLGRFSASESARKKMAEERKKKRERERRLREMGLL